MNKKDIRNDIKNKFKNIDKNLLFKKSEQLKNEILSNPIVLKSKTIGFFV
jgi:5-formyltetrahydrofolate cyclo-ligase